MSGVVEAGIFIGFIVLFVIASCVADDDHDDDNKPPTGTVGAL